MKSSIIELNQWYDVKKLTSDDEIFAFMVAIMVCKANERKRHFVVAPISPDRHEMIVKSREKVWDERLNSAIEYVKNTKKFYDAKRQKGESIFETKHSRAERLYIEWFKDLKAQYKAEPQKLKEVIDTKISELATDYSINF